MIKYTQFIQNICEDVYSYVKKYHGSKHILLNNKYSISGTRQSFSSWGQNCRCVIFSANQGVYELTSYEFNLAEFHLTHTHILIPTAYTNPCVFKQLTTLSWNSCGTCTVTTASCCRGIFLR